MENLIDSHTEESEINFWPVYSDLAIVVVSILLLFLMAQFLIPTFTGGEILKTKEYQEELKKQFIISDDSLKSPIYKAGIASFEEDGNLQIVTFSSDIIFGLNQYNWNQLSELGIRLLSSFGSEIAKNQHKITRIQIEGHASWEEKHKFDTDEKYVYFNWEISAKRAIAVAKAFINQGVDPKKLSSAGRAHYVPYDQRVRSFKDSAAVAQASLNRRINVILFYSQHGVDSPILR